MKANELTYAEKKEFLIKFFTDMIITVNKAKDIRAFTINISSPPWDCEDHCEDHYLPKEVNYKMDLELIRGNNE